MTGNPSPEADSATLLRRLSLDLAGLPPTPEELSAPFDFNRESERLLASPSFGKRWAREWLDAARYSDSAGYEKDLPRMHHFYRDWVVAAMNAGMPYDEFIIKQIAGDLLPGATQDDRIATGYRRNSMTNEESGAKPEQFRIEGVFDRIDAIGKSVLGLIGAVRAVPRAQIRSAHPRGVFRDVRLPQRHRPHRHCRAQP